MDIDNEILTNDELVQLGILSGIDLDTLSNAIEQPVRAPEDVFVAAKLSKQTLLREQRRWAPRKKRKKYTFRRGTVHHKKKAATRRRRLAKHWATNPFGCMIHGYGSHAIDKTLFDKHILPFWSEYDPAELTIKKSKRDALGEWYGTKRNPFTIYSLVLSHVKHGTLFDGKDLELYMLSCPHKCEPGIVEEQGAD